MSSNVAGYRLEQLLEPVIAISVRAADAILEIYHSDFAIAHKQDNSPLTAADMASHHSICRDLQSLTPDIPILSEESADSPWEQRKNRTSYWLIDPLDGTREFVKRNGEFSVNIALIHKHQPVLGVVYIPVTKTGYFASAGQGAFKLVNSLAPMRVQTRKARIGKLTVAGSRSHGNTQQQAFIESLGPETETVIAGSSLKLCLVAEGLIDIYPRFGPTSEWDTAAAQCIVEQAGGLVTDTQFQPLRYNAKESLLNPDFLVIGDASFAWQDYVKPILEY